MTLTLEQVRQTRFHLARRNGYEPADVDNFVDQVELTMAQLADENLTLKHQVEALGAGAEDGRQPSVDPAATDESRRLLTEAHGELDLLRAQLDAQQNDLTGVRAELETAQGVLAESDQGEVVARLQSDLVEARAASSAADRRIADLTAELAAVRAELAEAQAAQQERISRVENITVTAAPDASSAVTKLLQMATEQAERLVGDAETDAERITVDAAARAESTVGEASNQAHETLIGAHNKAEEIERQARQDADSLTSAAQAEADALQAEVAERRAGLVSTLEAERDELQAKVEQLRSFEGRYRQSMTSQLRAHLASLSERAEPNGAPDAPGTPRLDALLAESK